MKRNVNIGSEFAKELRTAMSEYVMVPRVPTEAMWEATLETKHYVAFDRFQRDYRAFLAATPAPVDTDPQSDDRCITVKELIGLLGKYSGDAEVKVATFNSSNVLLSVYDSEDGSVVWIDVEAE